MQRVLADSAESKALISGPQLNCTDLTGLRWHQHAWQGKSSLGYRTYTFIFFHVSMLAVISGNLLLFIKESSTSE